MDQRGKEPAARSCRKEFQRQAAGLVVSNWLMAGADIRCKVPLREGSKWKPGMSLGHMP
jgi:hypothetical protein